MEPMNATKIKSLALGLLVALSGLSACISYDNQDQYCDVLTSADNLNDACPYGPPGGAKFAERAQCPTVNVNAASSDCSGANSWSANVWPKIGGTCAGTAGGGCHADGVKGIKLDATNAQAAYEVLAKYTGASNRPYLSNINPGQAWILCNLTPMVKDGGLTMPPPPLALNADALAAVTTWAQCGQAP
jgi:hypothetical protein